MCRCGEYAGNIVQGEKAVTKRYVYAFFGSAIVLIGLLAGYGIYVNASSSAHMAKMTASQYIRVKSAPVIFREIAPVVYFPGCKYLFPKDAGCVF